MKILLIEDEPQMRRNMASVLRLENFQVIEAENGMRGVEAARREAPDVVISDVMMPELDGYGVLSELRRDPATARIPFLFLTAKGEKADQRLGMNSGADDYITKPVDIHELVAAVRARLERQEIVEAALRAGPDFSSAAPLQQAFGLTQREAEVLLWLAQGKSNNTIASILNTAESTVKKHLEHVFEKLGVENRAAAALDAVRVLSGRKNH